MKIGTLTTGEGIQTSFKLNYLPQYVYYIAATALTGLKVTVAGDGVIADLNGYGLAAVSGIGRFGAVANSYLIPLADGFVPNKVVEMVFINSADQTPDIYGFSLQKASGYITSLNQIALASSGAIFEQFLHIGILSMAAADSLTIQFVDGHVQDFADVELKGWYTLYSNEVDSFTIDNTRQSIDWLKLIPSTDRTVVVTKAHPLGTLTY